MAIKSKNNKRLGLAALLLALLSAVVLLLFPSISKNARQNQDSLYEKSYFVNRLYENGFVLYWELLQKNTGEPLMPDEVFLPGLAQAIEESEEYSDEEWALGYLSEYCYSELTRWRNRFHREWNTLAYLALDNDGNSIGNAGADLRELAQDWQRAAAARNYGSYYDYIALIRYDQNGSIEIPYLLGASSTSLDLLKTYGPWEHWEYLMGDRYQSVNKLHPPSAITIVYAVPKGADKNNSLLWDQQAYEAQAFGNAGFTGIYFVALLAAALIGLVLAWKGSPFPRPLDRLPLELSLLPFLLSRKTAHLLVQLGNSIAQGHLALRAPVLVFSGARAQAVGYVLSCLALLLTLAAVCAGAAGLCQIRQMGLPLYLQTRSLCWSLVQACRVPYRRFTAWLGSVDFSQPGAKIAKRLLILNLVLTSLFCCMWFGGILFLIPYTIIFAVCLIRYLGRMQRQYDEVLRATSEMAHGRLDTSLEADLGPFQALGDKLQEIQDGFRQAVEAEVRSQNMKTELISNVSHDLKTPLTAIITYINLLRQDGLTDEDRQNYLETLDSKAQRLKVLIEDLFEVSKASSGNLSLELSPVELVSLLKQVELEAGGPIAQSQIEFRHNYPGDRVMMLLDGEKTYRIFDNLILNVTKYALPRTRAYIDLTLTDSHAVVEVKNISRDPLDFDPDRLTERFVRGDRSRNTEGSGLGLAIVKSFTEAQGGSFQVITDGDLFKAVVTLPLPPQKEHNTQIGESQ